MGRARGDDRGNEKNGKDGVADVFPEEFGADDTEQSQEEDQIGISKLMPRRE